MSLLKKVGKLLVAVGFGVAVAEARHRTGLSYWDTHNRPT
jgi:hypothetical protein